MVELAIPALLKKIAALEVLRHQDQELIDQLRNLLSRSLANTDEAMRIADELVRRNQQQR